METNWTHWRYNDWADATEEERKQIAMNFRDRYHKAETNLNKLRNILTNLVDLTQLD